MLFGVNFRPLQEIEAIMGGGRIFATGSFFVRLRYLVYSEQLPACANSYNQLVTFSHVDSVHCSLIRLLLVKILVLIMLTLSHSGSVHIVYEVPAHHDHLWQSCVMYI